MRTRLRALRMLFAGACMAAIFSCEEVAEPPHSGGASLRTIFTTVNDPQAIIDQYATWGVEPAMILYQSMFDPGDSGTWSRPDLTQAWLDAYCPVEYGGYLTIDWEGQAMEVLQAGPDHLLHGSTLAEMTSLALFLKSQRPGAWIGFYGLPLKVYWSQNAAWYEAMAACAPLFEACDALFPSVYDFYEGNALQDKEKFGNIVALALELAAGKPVLPYVWHRYHDSNDEVGFKLIPEPEAVDFIHHLTHVVEVDGRKAAGLIAWGPDKYFYTTGMMTDPDGSWTHQGESWDKVRAAFGSELLPDESIEAYLLRRRPQVYGYLRQALSGS